MRWNWSPSREAEFQRWKDETFAKYDAEQRGDIFPSRIVLIALGFLVSLQQMTGLSVPLGFSELKEAPNQPYQGNDFAVGSQFFTDCAALLGQGVPPTWEGKAADVFGTANDDLIKLAETIASLDLDMERFVKEHAGVISEARMGIGIEQDTLIVALPIIFFMEKNATTYLKAWKAARALAAAAIAAAVGLLGWCLGTSIQAQLAVDKLGYGAVLEAAKKIAPSAATLALPAGSVVSDVAPMSSSVSGASGFAGTSSVASSSGSASGSGQGRAPLDASPAEGQPFGADSTQVAETLDQAAPLTVSPMPGLAPMSQSSGPAPIRSGGVASPGGRPNPPPGQGADEGSGDVEDTPAAVIEGTGIKIPAAYAALGRSAAEPAETPATTPAA